MQVDFSTKILDIDGKPVKDGEKDLTLKSVACTALLASFPDEGNAPAETKVSRFKLALRCVEGGKQELSSEEVIELRATIGKAFGPLVVGRVFAILEKAEKPGK